MDKSWNCAHLDSTCSCWTASPRMGSTFLHAWTALGQHSAALDSMDSNNTLQQQQHLLHLDSSICSTWTRLAASSTPASTLTSCWTELHLTPAAPPRQTATCSTLLHQQLPWTTAHARPATPLDQHRIVQGKDSTPSRHTHGPADFSSWFPVRPTYLSFERCVCWMN
jgi:hypothetical protein